MQRSEPKSWLVIGSFAGIPLSLSPTLSRSYEVAYVLPLRLDFNDEEDRSIDDPGLRKVALIVHKVCRSSRSNKMIYCQVSIEVVEKINNQQP